MASKHGSLSTGKIVSSYIRPDPQPITKGAFDELLRLEKGKQLGPNTWLITTKPAGRGPYGGIRGACISHVGFRNQGKYYVCQIPTDKKGLVSQLNMAERLLDVESGDRQGHMRNVMVDIGVNAKAIHNPKELAKIYRWWIFPNETDVEKIDDARSMIVELMGKGSKWGKAKVLIVGGTQEQREQIAKDLTANFTLKEKRIIHNCLIEIVPNNRSYAGCFQGTTDDKGNIVGTPKIAICERHVAKSGCIIHESVHALREFDVDRDPKLRAVKHYWGQDADLEESLTEAETTGRQRPFTKDQESAGYYHYLKIGHKDRGDLINEDRVTITGAKEKGLKGKRVQKAVILRYPMTNIAHLKIKGNAEAIDTYRDVERRTKPGKTLTTHIHMYKPDGTAASDRAQDKALAKQTTGEITQWEDGKKTMVREGTNTLTELVNEVIIYGGLPAKRKDVYRDALEVTGSKTAADLFAFGQQTKLAPPGSKPLSYQQLKKIRKSKPRKAQRLPRSMGNNGKHPKASAAAHGRGRPGRSTKAGPYNYRGGGASRKSY